MNENKHPGIRFTGVDLLKLEFGITGGFSGDSIAVAPSFSIEARVPEDKKTLDLFLAVDLFGNVAEEKRPPIQLSLVLHGHFEATETPYMALDEFAKHQAPAHLFPYLRELVANITSRSPLPTLNLGPVNVVALIERGDASFEYHLKEKDVQQV